MSVERRGMRKLTLILSTLVLLSLGCALVCVAEPTPVYLCPKVDTAPVIDGKVDDPVWQTVPAVRLVICPTGQPATKETIARMCYDDQRLYVSFQCKDEDIWNDYTKHDDPVYNQEVCEAFLVPTCDLDSYFEINISPRNVSFDALIRHAVKGVPGEGTDHGWTCKDLQHAVALDGTIDNRKDTDKGFSVEFSLPFSSFGRSTPKFYERWRGNFYRIDLMPKPEEFQSWSPTYQVPAAFHVPERFGTIFFVGKQ